MRYAHAARTAVSRQPSAYFIQKLKGKHLGVGHATRMATLRQQLSVVSLGRWPRYANG
ncbi:MULTISPECIES: hypothetical protein [unclassified Moorena]|uniref:hypothetical protein n=1 Tax=unclassified Moorena TaxID=2683338 RepID=UPI0013FE700D|nr:MULTISPECIES: hypothetical protein [unclassified Moorena]NEO16101.1 hypothetical protein [Moorena sp. SIO3E8]NEQ02606.1 hypothetical protein [Moorena sp. SIO3F7]